MPWKWLNVTQSNQVIHLINYLAYNDWQSIDSPNENPI